MASTGLEPRTGPAIDWSDILAEVNGWRGACMHHFSAAEMGVTETLFALAAVPGHGETVRLRQLIGQRLDDLASAIGPEGPFFEQGARAFSELSRYRERQEAFRALLCHGFIRVLIDQTGDWTLVIRSLAIRARQAERGLLVLDKAEALARLTNLKAESAKLGSLLGQLRKMVSDRSPP